MAGGVARRGHQQHGAVAKHIVLTIDQLVVQRVLPEPRIVAAARGLGGLHLGTLDQKSGPTEQRVAAAVVEVQVRVGHIQDVVGNESQVRELAWCVLVRRTDHLKG